MKKLILLTLLFSYFGSFSQNPTTAAATPTHSTATSNIKSIYSDAFSNVAVTDWGPNWGASSARIHDSVVAGNNTKMINMTTGKAFAGIVLTSGFDATAYTHFRINFWMTGPAHTGQVISFKLSNHAAGGGEVNAIEHQIVAPAVGQWVTVDVPLSSFTVASNNTNRNNIKEIIISAARANLNDTNNIYFDNMYFYGPLPSLDPAPVPTRAAADVISVFSDTYTNIAGSDLNPNWGQATQVSQFSISGNNTLKYKTLNYQGLQLGSTQDLTAAGMTHLHIDFLTKQTGTLRLSLISTGPNEVPYTLTIPTTGWTSLDIPLTSFPAPVNLAQVIQLKFDNNAGANFTDSLLIDNIYFYKIPSISAAPVPTRAAADVISVFSDTYTNIAGSDLNPNWGQATQVSQFSISGNNTLKYKTLNYQGLQLGSTQDLTAAGMTHLHIDFLTKQTGTLRLSLISTGPNEVPYTLTIPTTGWTSLDIPLTSFPAPVNLAQVIQLKFDNNGGANFTDSILIDNIYFYKNAAATISAAPTPTRASVDVISVFSDAYTNIGADLNPNWGQATQNTQFAISGNNTMKFKSFNYQGMQFNTAQDLTAAGMTHLHIDYYTGQTGTFRIFLISPPNETSYNLTIPTTGWSSMDIPLTAFAGVNLAQVLQIKFDNNGGANFTDSILIDNIYFYKNAAATISAAPTPTRASADVISVFSDAYTNIGADLNPNWGQATQNTQFAISGNNTMKFKSFNYQGMQFNTAQDLTAAGMTHLHIDYYTGQTGTFRIFLISPPNETSYNLTIPTAGWSSMDIPLTAFAGVNLAQVLQIKFDNNGGANFTDSILIDNIYFYKNATVVSGPLTPAPTPTAPEANVKSIYSDAYTNVVVSEWGPDWGPSSARITDFPISGNNNKVIDMAVGKAFAGIVLASGFDANPYTHFRANFWMSGPAYAGQVLSFKLSNHASGGGEVNAIQHEIISPAVGQWVTVDVALSSFTVANSNANRNNIKEIIVSAARASLNDTNKIYLDNIYFYNSTITPPPAGSCLNSNGDFSDGATGWILDGGGTVLSGEAHFSTSNTTGDPWGTQLAKSGLSLAAGTSYTLTFKARAAANRNLTVAIQNIGTWDNQTPNQVHALTTTMQTFTQTFNATTTNTNVNLGFLLGMQGSSEAVYIDDVCLKVSTITPPPAGEIKLPISFEDATLNYSFSDFGGATTTKVTNPQSNGLNTSATVAKTVKGTGAETWAGSFIQTTNPISFGTTKGIKLKVWSPKAGIKVRVKIENATSDTIFEEIDQTVTTANTWQELKYTFSKLTRNYSKVVVFFDFGVAGANETFYFDDIDLDTSTTTPPPPPTPDTLKFPLTFEKSSLYAFSNIGTSATSIVANPYMDASNTSALVAKTTKATGAIPLSGPSIQFPTNIDLTNATSIKMQVWSPLALIKVKIRLYSSLDPNKFIDIDQYLGMPNSWQELEFVLPRLTGSAATEYSKFVVFFDADNAGTGADFYFDNVRVLKSTSGISTVSLTGLIIYPNPAKNFIHLESLATINMVEIYSINGQKVLSKETKGTQLDLDIRHLSQGQYILRAYNKDMVSNINFIKE